MENNQVLEQIRLGADHSKLHTFAIRTLAKQLVHGEITCPAKMENLPWLEAATVVLKKVIHSLTHTNNVEMLVVPKQGQGL